MKMKPHILLVLLLAFLIVAGGCGNSGTSEQKDSLTMSVPVDITNLDPQNHVDYYSYLADVQIYDSLLYLDDFTNEYVMKLATSMEWNDDATKLTVKIKEGVKFTNGEELKASDVKFTIDRAIASEIYGSRVAMIDSCNVIDDYTVEIVLVNPYAPINSVLQGLFIVSEKAVTAAGSDYGNDVESVVGSGAYKIASWDKGQGYTFVRNEDYHGDAAFIKDITVKIIPDASTAIVALQNGEIDYIWELPPTQVRNLEDAEGVQIISSDTMNTAAILLNCSKPPFDNVDLRRAVAYAIDRDEATLVATDGTAKALNTYVAKGAFGLDETITAPARDIEKAKEYLVKAGYPNGLKIKILTQDDEAAKYMPVIQANLAEIGITAEIETLEWNASYDKKFAYDYELSDFIVSNRYLDTDFLYLWFKSDSSNNLAGFKNAELDKLLIAGRSETDPDKRIAIYKSAQEIMRDEVAEIPIFQSVGFSAAAEGLEGVVYKPVLINEFRNIKWSD